MPVNPLNAEQIDQLRQAQEAIKVVEEQINLAERAGLPVSDQRRELQELREQVRKLLDVYGNLPPAPSVNP